MAEQNTAADVQGYHPVLTSREYARTFSALGIRKANTRTWQQLLLGFLAGMYISVGSHLFLVAMNAGMGRIWAGAVFGVGLVLVVVAGAELFTGNIIMVIGTITRQFSLARMLRNWIAVYGGNLAGAYLFALMVWASGIFGTPAQPTDMGTLAVKVAEAKLSLTFGQAFLRGVLCNMLVILAIIMALMSKDNVSKILCCILPIMAFVASGFEHCVANMYLVPAGLLAKGVPFADQGVMWRNILPVTLGNIAGGIGILVLHPNRIRQLAQLWRPRRETAPAPAAATSRPPD
jgi:formate/nitrite transporter